MRRTQSDWLINTYSIVARDPETGELGVAVQTHQMAVGWIVPWLLPGLGAIATQSIVNISFGPMGLAMLKEGLDAIQVVDGLIASDTKPDVRQLAVVDSQGRVGAWTGSGCIPDAGHHSGEGYSVQANMMDRNTVVPAMREAFEGSKGRLADRMMAALEAAESKGGDIRGMQSAAIKIVEGDPIKAAKKKDWESHYDLRVDEHPQPLLELKRLVRLQTAQLISEDGEEAMKDGRQEDGQALWQQARQMAPELEELGFWQAMVLADNYDDISGAASILHEVIMNNPRRDHWLNLVSRLQTSGIIEREGVADALLPNLTASKK